MPSFEVDYLVTGRVLAAIEAEDLRSAYDQAICSAWKGDVTVPREALTVRTWSVAASGEPQTPASPIPEAER